MLGYYVQLALKSLQRAPGLTALMISAIALGIAVCVVTLTVYHAMAGNPIWWKSDRLFAVTMDSWDPNEPYDPRHPQLPPPLLSYKDTKYLSGSGIPEHQVVMFKMRGVLSGAPAQSKPVPVISRITTADFFAAFDVPFLYGSGWRASSDRGPDPVIVLSREQNDRLFGGTNSVGRLLRWNDRQFRIVGVLDAWFPQPKFYDVIDDPFGVPEDVYIPFGWGELLEQYPAGRVNCWGAPRLDSFRDFLGSDCVWTLMWVELPDAASRERMQTFIDSYWSRQHQAGRFPRPRSNHLTTVGDWLVQQEIVSNDNRMLVGFAFGFLAVCILNTVGILLAKFLRAAAFTGIRRAIGASRLQIAAQHLVEVAILSACGAALGLGLSALGLQALHALYAGDRDDVGGYQALMHIDTVSVVWAIVLAAVTTLAGGLYPAWRIGRVPPAVYLKGR